MFEEEHKNLKISLSGDEVLDNMLNSKVPELEVKNDSRLYKCPTCQALLAASFITMEESHCPERFRVSFGEKFDNCPYCRQVLNWEPINYIH